MNELANCIHCGLCLEACPTYRVSGDEAEGPRGRLRLMAELRAGAVLDFTPLDHCLGCRGCESVCPSGVPYGAHLDEARALRRPSALQAFVVDRVLSERRALALALRVGRGVRAVGLARWLPERLRLALDAMPSAGRVEGGLPRRREGSIALLPGCAQSLLQPEVLEALLRLLEALGERPYIADLPCCGALSAHQGSPATGSRRRVELRDRLPRGTPLLVPAAGCSAHLRGLDGVHDALQWLSERAAELRFAPARLRVLYHPPCHHSHAQGLRGAAEALLARVPELTRLIPDDPERCCGSAGSYSLFEPGLAGEIRAQKWSDLRAAAPELVLSANPGCEFHLAAGRAPGDPPVVNLFRFLADRLGSDQGNR